MNKIVRILFLLGLGFLVICFLSVNTVMSVVPKGANYTEVKTENAPWHNPQDHDAYAGNVTELDITGYTITQNWQGYYGNVSGTIYLADASDNVLYNWSLASPEGEVYAANESSVTWTNIQCFNFTATGTYADDSSQRGATSFYGMNLSQLENSTDIEWDDVDGVNETFSLAGTHESGDGLTHDLFYTNNLEFNAGECLSTHLFNHSGSGADSQFQEVLLYDPDNQVVVFTSILDEEDVSGFDNEYHDFEMLVLDDGHGTDLDPTIYYFYVELE
ncbi:hypothetical protein GF386_01655 [Candidatus Pacearchaeota archaeon]|nr:hypothetical protein [Candidatus Pacearchaeota archaeon]MBD3282885.1 hypothetical protein [Candidatus Pacearchaeota archaeon]